MTQLDIIKVYMELEHEIICGPVCQHPSCWLAQRHANRGQRRVTDTGGAEDEESDDEGLPTQSVVNLLDNYGPDQDDRYSAQWNNQPSHFHLDRKSSYGRNINRSSYPRTQVPSATPISNGVRSTSGASSTRSVSHVPRGPPQVSRVEVQEVFDLNDLHSDWQDTFKARQYYVWVPKSSQSRPRRLSPLQRRPGSSCRSPSGRRRIKLKDKTEEMIPTRIERQREQSSLRKYLSPCRRSPTGGRPYPVRHSMSWLRRDKEFGLYDLLDLPHPILGLVLEQLADRDTITQEELMSILQQYMPQSIVGRGMQTNPSDLAGPEPLQPHKMPILENNMKAQHTGRLYDSKQVYQQDQTMPLAQMKDPVNDRDILPLAELRNSNSTLTVEEDDPDRTREQLLPPITDKMKPIRSVSLGLPELPSGVRSTRPFTYKKHINVDLSLGPIPSPPPPSEHSSSAPDSPVSSEHGSILQVTIPTAASPPENNENLQEYPPKLETYDEKTRSPKGMTSPHQTSGALGLTGDEEQGQGQPPKPGSAQVPSAYADGSVMGTALETDRATAANSTNSAHPPTSHGNRNVRFAPDLQAAVDKEPPPQPPSSPNNSEGSRSVTSPISVRQVQGVHLDGCYPVGTTMGLAHQGRDLMVVGKGSRVPGLSAKSPIVVPSPMIDHVSPEPWPQVDEEAYNRSPTPRQGSSPTPNRNPSNPPSGSLAKSVALSSVVSIGFPGESMASSASPEKSNLSLLPTSEYSGQSNNTGVQHGLEKRDKSNEVSGVVSDSDKAKMILGGHLKIDQSPAPPPPSPEPKDHLTGHVRTNSPSALTTLEDTTETESKKIMGILVEADSQDILETEGGNEKEAEKGTEEHKNIAASEDNDQETDESKVIQSENSPLTRTTKTNNTNESMIDSTGAKQTDVHVDNLNEEGDLDPQALETSINPVMPVITVDSQELALEALQTSAESSHSANVVENLHIDTLEQFDVTEESLRQELVEEYEKLSQEGGADKDQRDT